MEPARLAQHIAKTSKRGETSSCNFLLDPIPQTPDLSPPMGHEEIAKFPCGNMSDETAIPGVV
ncbi:uncharacterized protein PHALS_03732 [Plasmopara halstedii]|uniref:Uncharacterized protein n=1 Tax=Plasmopara halstedii TaxID=4781 RepID=A0A0P1B0A0_PLAHL|nr:uncharacterized protein PHALS_03732 [Plasmopara halstedii]CEG47071.1 hypothetical protein PHALS_03732 [Plasmopara halstedii]|eukprot:XP_024583440.1 hypothetical protein PHALS_03732 [Plasmopara halstedii]